jgi:hypothetical protein
LRLVNYAHCRPTQLRTIHLENVSKPPEIQAEVFGEHPVETFVIEFGFPGKLCDNHFLNGKRGMTGRFPYYVLFLISPVDTLSQEQ